MTHFRVRVRKAEIEIEVDSSDKDYTEAKLRELLVRFVTKAPPVPKTPGAARVVSSGPGKTLSLSEHVRALSPKSGTQQVIAVGDYLERYGGMPDGFRTRDIAAGFKTIKFKHSNPAEAVRQAKSQGLLMDGKESGTLVITSTAEAWIKTQLGSEATEGGDG
jgi:hypothetical protein